MSDRLVWDWLAGWASVASPGRHNDGIVPADRNIRIVVLLERRMLAELRGNLEPSLSELAITGKVCIEGRPFNA